MGLVGWGVRGERRGDRVRGGLKGRGASRELRMVSGNGPAGGCVAERAVWQTAAQRASEPVSGAAQCKPLCPFHVSAAGCFLV